MSWKDFIFYYHTNYATEHLVQIFVLYIEGLLIDNTCCEYDPCQSTDYAVYPGLIMLILVACSVEEKFEGLFTANLSAWKNMWCKITHTV